MTDGNGVVVLVTVLAEVAGLSILSDRSMRYELGAAGVITVLFLMALVYVLATGRLYG